MLELHTPQELATIKVIHDRYEHDYAAYVARLLARSRS
jgi:hypothetical protein